ncbi:papain family cysteine protease, partial [Helicosporidium sp. ATCC 50920]
MKGVVRVCLLALAIVAVAANSEANKKHKKHSPPVWADIYTVKFDFKIPYVSEYQKDPVVNKFEVWQDTKNGFQRVVKDGLETILCLVDADAKYTIYPAKDEYNCMKTELGSGPSGPTRRLQSVAAPGAQLRVEENDEDEAESAPASVEKKKKISEVLTFVMPDLTEKRWVYQGRQSMEGLPKDTEMYEYDLKNGDMKQTYRMYVSADGTPLRLWQLGTNLYTGGHKDVYISDFYDYAPQKKAFDESVFAVPEWGNCPKNDAPPESAHTDAHGPVDAISRAVRRMTPATHYGDAHYDAFVHRHGRRHRHSAEYESRRAEFHSNRARIEAHNEAVSRGESRHTHTLGVNRFADWTSEEYEAMVRPPGRQRANVAEDPAVGRHRAALGNGMVPAQLSWKGTDADSPVKDQGACGSCWTFSTVGAIEAAYYRQKGRQQLFSEQNLVDCNWVKTNKGCYGGQQIDAFHFIFDENKGLATEEDYPYRAVNDFCKADSVPKVPFTGRMVLVEGGEEPLKEALASKGPMTVSVDAGDDTFR